MLVPPLPSSHRLVLWESVPWSVAFNGSASGLHVHAVARPGPRQWHHHSIIVNPGRFLFRSSWEVSHVLYEKEALCDLGRQTESRCGSHCARARAVRRVKIATKGEMPVIGLDRHSLSGDDPRWNIRPRRASEIFCSGAEKGRMGDGDQCRWGQLLHCERASFASQPSGSEPIKYV